MSRLCAPLILLQQQQQRSNTTTTHLQIRRLDERKEEIGRGNAVVSLPGPPYAAIERNLTVARTQILPIPQVQGLQHFVQLVLGDLAGSSLQVGIV